MNFYYLIKCGALSTNARNGVELDSYIKELLQRGFQLSAITVTLVTK